MKLTPPPQSKTARIAEILLPGIDRGGKPSRIATSFGPKTREGIAAIIDGETGLSKCLEALEMVLRKKDNPKETLLHGGAIFTEADWALVTGALISAGYTEPKTP